MNSRPHARELASQIQGLIVTRLLVMTVLGLLLWGTARAGLLGMSPGPSLALLAGVWVLTLLYWGGMRVGISLGGLVAVQVALDLVLETMLVSGTGGTNSPFVLLYFVTIFTGAMFVGRLGAMVTALGAVAAFSAVALLVGDGGPERLEPPRTFYEIGVHAAAFLLLAFLSGILAERSRRTREELETTAVELQRVMASTDRILQNMPIGLMTASSQGTILRSNRAARAILGVEPEDDLCGQPLAEFLGTFAPQFVETVEDVLVTRKWSVREEIVVRKGTREHPIGVSVTPLIHDGDLLEEVIVTFTDLREVRRMEREMRRSEQLASLGELAAGVAHEIRNPMASISGAVQVLRAEVKAEGDEAELMDLIVEESDRLNRIIDGVLDYTRDHSGSRSVHDLSATAREVVRLIQHDQKLCVGKTVLFEFPEGQDFRAEVEEGGMKQVFFNLVRNALEAMQVGGILRITGESPGDGRVYFAFRDTGEGIPPHELEHVFKPFHTSKKDGTGLGLSIASRIVEGNGGAIQAKSTPGVGTAITVELPAAGWSEGSSAAASEPKNEEVREPEPTEASR